MVSTATARVAPEATPAFRDGICLALLVVAALAVLWPALGNPLVLDDVVKIVDNPDIRLLSNLPTKLVYPYAANPVWERNDPSRPLVFLVWTLVYAACGLNPVGYHLVNALAHGLAGSFVFLLARRVQERCCESRNRWGPFLAGLFFAVAPIQVGTAGYAFGLSDVLSTALMCASVWSFVRRDVPSRGDTAMSLVLMVLALACKQSAVVVPVLIALFDLAFGNGGSRANWKWPTQYGAHVAVVGLYLLARTSLLGGIGDMEAGLGTLPAIPYACAQPWVVWNYVSKSLIPVGLSIDHAVFPQDLSPGMELAAFAAWVAVLVSITVAFLRRPSPWSRLWFFAVFWFLICVAPTSSILPTVDLMVERRAYLANCGLFLVLPWLYDRLAERGGGRRWAAGLSVALLAIHLLVYAGVSMARAAVFSSPTRLWCAVLDTYPHSQRGLNSLAMILGKEGRFPEAQQVFERLLELYPDDYLAHSNYGTLLSLAGNPHQDLEVALKHYRESERLRPSAESLFNIGLILDARGQLDEAMNYYSRTIELQPDFCPAIHHSAVILLKRGDQDRGRSLLERALRINPNYGPARESLQNLKQLEGLKPASGTEPVTTVP
jgi:Tfp pilus assembly protein PilF